MTQEQQERKWEVFYGHDWYTSICIPGVPVFHATSRAHAMAYADYLNALESELRQLRAKAALADEMRTYMGFVDLVGTGSSDPAEEAALDELLARYDALKGQTNA